MSEPPNAAQLAYWNGPIGREWAKAQEKRDRDHAEITKALLEFAAPQPGEHVIDIGCGSGTTTLLVSDRVGRSGKVLGIDISAPMLELARARAEASHSIAEFVEADATEYVLPRQAFDLALSQLGVMFFADPVIAFRNIRRALKKRSRLCFACWRSPAEHLWASIPEEAAKPFLPPSGPTANTGRFSLQHPDRIKQILTGAGFYALELSKFDARTFAGGTPDEAAASVIDAGPLQRTLAGADDATRAKVREAVTTRLAQEAGAGGVYLTSAVWLVRALA